MMTRPVSASAPRLLAGGSFLFFNDGNTLQTLRDRLFDLNEKAITIQAKADADKRDFTEDEAKELDDIFAQVENTTSDIERRERIEANSAAIAVSRGRQTEPNDPDDPESPVLQPNAAARTETPVTPRAAGQRPRVPASPRGADYGRRGFNNLGDFARSVVSATRPGGSVDPRLLVDAPSTFGSEGVGADGGFAVPPEFRTTIMEKVMGEDSLLGRTDLIDVTGNSITIPKDETTPWQTTGGIVATWEGEGQPLGQSKPQLEETTVRLNKLTALVPITNELLEDATALSSYVNKKAPEKIGFKVNLAILQGTGAGQPLGILNSPALISVAKESAQATGSIVYNNITKMFSRLYAPSRSTSIWLINQEIEPQLYGLQFPGSGTAVPAFLPPGGLSGAPYASLMGRPVIPTQATNALGSQGDIMLVDLKQYLAAQKVGGVRSETSIHLWFDYDLTAFRFILRVAGQPWWSAPISPRVGSNTYSAFVTLDPRP